MAKFMYIKPRKLNYKGEQYLQGSILEMSEFDNSLPRDWFEELKSTNTMVENSSIVVENVEQKENKIIGNKKSIVATKKAIK